MELTLVNPQKKAAGKVSVSDDVFAREFNETLIHQVVVAHMAGERQGTKRQKNRSEVRGGGTKPWRQKGTGRARAGTIRSPIWRTGGVTFAARPRDFSQKVNKKMYRVAMRSIVSELVRQERLVVVEEFTVASGKTKDLAAKLKELDISQALILTDGRDEMLERASGNIINIAVAPAQAIDPVSLVKFEKTIITVAALKQLEERLA